MKNILLFLSVFAFCNSAFAQKFDERNLIGEWVTTDASGDFYENKESCSFKSEKLDYMKLYEHCVHSDDSAGIVLATIIDSYYDYETGTNYDNVEVVEEGNISHWFISNENKLHMIVQHRTDLRYVITELTDNMLVLETYDGKGHLIMKRGNQTDINEIKEDKKVRNSSIYLLDGRATTTVPKRNIYIKNGQKRINR